MKERKKAIRRTVVRGGFLPRKGRAARVSGGFLPTRKEKAVSVGGGGFI